MKFEGIASEYGRCQQHIQYVAHKGKTCGSILSVSSRKGMQ